MKTLGNYIACFYRGLDGLKTYLMALAILLLGLAEYFSITDLKPVFEHYFGEANASLLAIVIPLVFAALRYITNSPAAGKAKAEDEGF
jgi:hypothetical protein